MWSRIVDLLRVVSEPESSRDNSDHPPLLMVDLVRVNYLPIVWLTLHPIHELRRLVHHLLRLSQQASTRRFRIGALCPD
jgi:hypothetical protein